MNLEEVSKYNLSINGQQAGLIFKTIKELDIKTEIGNLIFGDLKTQELSKKHQIISMKYNDLFNREVEKIMPLTEYKALKKADKESLWTEKLQHNKELYDLLLERETINIDFQNMNKENMWDLLEKIFLEKYYSNQDTIYELLANLYNISAEEVSKSSITVILAMFKNIAKSKDIEGMKILFK